MNQENLTFIQKFLGYYPNDKGLYQAYSDGLGNGFLDIRHLLWIIIAIAIIYIAIKAAKKNKEKTKDVIIVLLIFMLIQRITVQIIHTKLNVEEPYWRAIIPVHLCTIMIYLMPLTVLFNLKKIKMPVFILSIIGGAITIIDGDYFSNAFMNFETLEGMFAHTMLLIVPITMMVIEKRKPEYKDIPKTVVAIILIGIWSTIINCIIFSKGYESNYLYLVTNMLPNNIGDRWFIFIYEIIFAIVLFSIIYIANRKTTKIKDILKYIKNNKLKMFLSLVNIITITLVTIFATQSYTEPILNKEESVIKVAMTINEMREYAFKKENSESRIEKTINLLLENKEKVEAYTEGNTIKIKYLDSGNVYSLSDYRLQGNTLGKNQKINQVIFKIMLGVEGVIIVIDIIYLLVRRNKKKKAVKENA